MFRKQCTAEQAIVDHLLLFHATSPAAVCSSAGHKRQSVLRHVQARLTAKPHSPPVSSIIDAACLHSVMRVVPAYAHSRQPPAPPAQGRVMIPTANMACAHRRAVLQLTRSQQVSVTGATDNAMDKVTTRTSSHTLFERCQRAHAGSCQSACSLHIIADTRRSASYSGFA